MDKQIPVIDIPAGEEDTQQLAENMSDVELRALVILTMRYSRETVEFCRSLQSMMEGMMSNPMLAAAMGGTPSAESPAVQRLRQSGLVAPNGL